MPVSFCAPGSARAAAFISALQGFIRPAIFTGPSPEKERLLIGREEPVKLEVAHMRPEMEKNRRREAINTREMIRQERAGVRWEAVESFAPLLERLLATPSETIKDAAPRRITRHQLNGRRYYVKRHFYGSHWWGPIKTAVKGPVSRGAWAVARELEARGVAVAPHRAHGERWSWLGLVESVLITEESEGVDLRTIQQEALPGAQRALGEFVRRIHEAGVFHRDLHVANLLYASTTNTFCLIDVANVALKNALDSKERLVTLAKLNSRLPLLPAFYEGYASPETGLEEKVAAATKARFRAGLSRDVNLSLRPGLSFAPRQFGDLVWQVRVRELNEDIEDILRDPDGFLDGKAQMLKRGTSSTVGRRAGVVLKRSNPRKLRNLVIDLFRLSRGRRAFRLARRLELVKVASPRPLATADRMRFGMPWRSYFLMDEIAGATPLYKWPGPRLEGIPRVAALLARLHEEGFSHSDLKDSNVVFDAQGRPFLLDLDGLRYVRRVSDRRAARNLSRLTRALLANEARLKKSSKKIFFTRSDRLRFLRQYCQQRGRADWRWWWRQIERELD